MIIVGDIAVSEPKYSNQLNAALNSHKGIFEGKSLVCNLEGLLMEDISTNHNTPVLFNHPSVVEVLTKWNTKVAALANNHTLDISDYYQSTAQQLKSVGIEAPGAGFSETDANAPVVFDDQGKKVFLFNHCWHVMLQHQQNPSKGVYVSTINEKRILADVEECKKSNPDAAIVVYLHWSFDLETLPFPLYRQFSKALIDAGANVVVGCHSHCVQGGETYKDGYIVYGLGNFFVPWYTFIRGTIHFPEFARTEMAFEWDPHTNKAFCHWFKYENEGDDHQLKHLASEEFGKGDYLKKYSAFAGMNDKSYLDFFRTNRRKKGGIPIYTDYRSTLRNNIIDNLIIGRIRFARLLAKYKLREWNN